MQKDSDDEKKAKYPSGPMTLLELMTVLGALGILLTWVLHRFYTG